MDIPVFGAVSEVEVRDDRGLVIGDHWLLDVRLAVRLDPASADFLSVPARQNRGLGQP